MKQLFKKCEKASGESKRQLFEQIADALAVHASLEEKHFYPATRSARTEDLLQEAVEEHLSVKRIADSAQGLFCAAGAFHLDPVRPVERAVLTHAHGDHARRIEIVSVHAGDGGADSPAGGRRADRNSAIRRTSAHHPGHPARPHPFVLLTVTLPVSSIRLISVTSWSGRQGLARNESQPASLAPFE